MPRSVTLSLDRIKASATLAVPRAHLLPFRFIVAILAFSLLSGCSGDNLAHRKDVSRNYVRSMIKAFDPNTPSGREQLLYFQRMDVAIQQATKTSLQHPALAGGAIFIMPKDVRLQFYWISDRPCADAFRIVPADGSPPFEITISPENMAELEENSKKAIVNIFAPGYARESETAKRFLALSQTRLSLELLSGGKTVDGPSKLTWYDTRDGADDRGK